MNPFWNGEERRLRTLWRLLLQVVLLVVALVPAQLVVGLLAALLVDLRSLPQGSVSEVQDWLTRQPAFMAVSTVAIALAMLLGVWAAARLLDHRPLADLGLHGSKAWWADFGFGLALGAVLMTLIFVVESLAGWVTVRDVFVTRDPQARFWPIMLLSAIHFVCVGFYEELFSRGYQLTNLAEGFAAMGRVRATWLAAIASGAVFGALHLTNPHASWIAAVNIMVSGVLTLGLGYLLTGELGLSIGLHITWNLVQGNVFGFPVSGTDYRAATILLIEQGGPELWTGGAFGPEAGLLGLLATLLGALLITGWVRVRRGKVTVCERLAAYARPARAQPRAATPTNSAKGV